MSDWGDYCTRCGQKMRLLFSSWYCTCEDLACALVGYGIVDTTTYENLPTEDQLPKTFCLHLFKDRTVAKEFNDAFLGFTLLQVDLSFEKHIFWSTKEKLWIHEATRILPCKVL